MDLAMSDNQFGFTPSDRELLIVLKVTLADVKEDLKDLATRLARLEGERTDRITRHELEDTYSDIDELRKQVGELRDWRWFVMGISATVGVVGGLLVKLVFK